jgi:hypothetical protein
MAKFLVEGVIKVKIQVEADSEEEAYEVAEENFDFEKHVDSESLPIWDVANELEPEIEDDYSDDDSYSSTVRRSMFDEDDD